MKIDKNDPKLTAYVMNELADSEKKQIEAAMEADSELRHEVELLKKSSGLLVEALADKEEHRLQPEQREKIFALLTAKKKPAPFWKLAGSLVTASLAVILLRQYSKQQSYESAVAPAEATAPMQAPALKLSPNKFRPTAKKAEKVVLAERLKDTASPSGELASSMDAADSMARAESAAVAQSQNLAAGNTPLAKRAAAPSAQASLSGSVVLEWNKFPDGQDVPKTESNIRSIETLANHCLRNYIVKYMQLDIVLAVGWSVKEGRAVQLEISDSKNTGLLNEGVKKCLQDAVASQNWNFVNTTGTVPQFEIFLKIISK